VVAAATVTRVTRAIAAGATASGATREAEATTARVARMIAAVGRTLCWLKTSLRIW
jgi:hypothetical protein